MVQRKNINRGYMRLDVWCKAMQLLKLVNTFLCETPNLDRRLRSQILDAAQSISANIAEGYCRRSVNEYIQYLSISLGSSGELLTRMIGLRALRILPPERFEEFDALHYHVENLLLQLIRSLNRKKDEGSWDMILRERSEKYRLVVSTPAHV